MVRVLAVTNMYPTAKDPTLGTFVEQQIKGLREIGLEVEVMYVNRAEKGTIVYPKLYWDILHQAKSWRPDIVHVMYGGVMADIVTHAIQTTPVVVSFCGTDLLGEHLSGTLRKWISRWSVVSSYRAARLAQGIVVKSKNLFDALPADIARSKVRVVPNGIDLDRFKPLSKESSQKKLGWSPNRFHVLFPFNQGDSRKRPWLGESAVNLLRSRNIKAELHQLRGVPHTEVPIWLNASDVILLTSLHEGSPNVIKEALACNVPIVSVDVGDVRERIKSIDGCYLASPDPRDLAVKLFAVSNGPNRVKGRVNVQDLSLKNVALSLRELYLQVTSSSPNPSRILPPEKMVSAP